jgi:hypothetical protein
MIVDLAACAPATHIDSIPGAHINIRGLNEVLMAGAKLIAQMGEIAVKNKRDPLTSTVRTGQTLTLREWKSAPASMLICVLCNSGQVETFSGCRYAG